jgi:hypothetical protein
MAALYHQHAANYQVGTHLGWALNHIQHDQSEWLREWIVQADICEEPATFRTFRGRISLTSPAHTILGTISTITPDALALVLELLPSASYHLQQILLDILHRLALLRAIPAEQRVVMGEKLLSMLSPDIEGTLRCTSIVILGHWYQEEAAEAEDDGAGDVEMIGRRLLEYMSTNPLESQEQAVLYTALSRLASRERTLRGEVEPILQSHITASGATAAFVRLSLAIARDQDRETSDFGIIDKHEVSTTLLARLSETLPDSKQRLNGLLDAGLQDEYWDDNYHDVLALAGQSLITSPDGEHLQDDLLRYLDRAIDEEDWLKRRIALAMLTWCMSVMPIAVQQTAMKVLMTESMESLLVQCTTVAESEITRGFALTALSHLRTVTPAVVPALLAGCQDTDDVQQDAITAAGRFQQIEGTPAEMLALLVPALTGESIQTAYAVTQLLGALGTSAAGEAAGLRDAIIAALVAALGDSGSQREVTVRYETKKLADVYYEVLLQVAGVPA